MKSKLTKIDWDLKAKEKAMIEAFRALEKIEAGEAGDKAIEQRFEEYLEARNEYMSEFGIGEIDVEEQLQLLPISEG